MPGLFVHEVGPGPRIDAWTYLTLGAWSAVHSDDGHGLEFIITAPQADVRMVELLTMVAYYYAGPASQRLDVGHTVPVGEPWLPMSACDHLLVGLPYAYGPELERCEWRGGHARLLGLVPITEQERAYKVQQGVDALEARLETLVQGLWTRPDRQSCKHRRTAEMCRSTAGAELPLQRGSWMPEGPRSPRVA